MIAVIFIILNSLLNLTGMNPGQTTETIISIDYPQNSRLDESCIYLLDNYNSLWKSF